MKIAWSSHCGLKPGVWTGLASLVCIVKLVQERNWHNFHTLLVAFFVVSSTSSRSSGMTWAHRSTTTCSSIKSADFVFPGPSASFTSQASKSMIQATWHIQLTFPSSQLPEVRFLASFLPVMCVKLATR
eukprot:758241-Hanusia_phi.AAC.4